MAAIANSMSTFARSVLDVIDRIPAGQVMSYGEIAATVGSSARAVGGVLTAWSDETHWHRVVYADGTPASCHEGSGVDRLAAEGVPIHNGRVDMARSNKSDDAG